NDQQLDPARGQKLSILDRVPLDCSQRFRSIRHARSVAKINEALVRQMFMQRPIDCQSTYAAVEDADGKIAVQDTCAPTERYHIIRRLTEPRAVATGNHLTLI